MTTIYLFARPPQARPLVQQAELEAEDGEAEEAEEQPAAVSGLPFPPEERDLWELRHARRRGGESGYRHQRPNHFYPISESLAPQGRQHAHLAGAAHDAPDCR